MEVKLNMNADQLGMTATSEEGKKLDINASSALGGEGKGMSPMELTLVALGGCTSIDVLMILKKQRLEIRQYDIEVYAERAETQPRVFTSARLVYKLDGDVSAEKAFRAIHLSMDKYCSVSKMLDKAFPISFELILNGKKESE